MELAFIIRNGILDFGRKRGKMTVKNVQWRVQEARYANNSHCHTSRFCEI